MRHFAWSTVVFLMVSCFSVAASTNRVLVLNGSTAFVKVPSSPTLNQLGTNFTVEAWALYEKIPNGITSYIICKGWYGLAMAFTPTNKLSAGVPGYTGGKIIESSTKISSNEWHHVAFTFDGSTRRLYIDGNLDTTSAIDHTVVLSSSNLVVGGNSSEKGDFLKGKLDEVRIWKRARSETEIRETINHMPTGTQQDLVAYWNFDDGTAGDISGSTNDGTLQGAATIIEETIPPLVFLTSLQISALDVQWNSLTGLQYQVQYSDSLISPAWSNLGPVYVGSGSNMYYMDIIRGVPTRNYRVIVP